jgi:cell division protein FtsN
MSFFDDESKKNNQEENQTHLCSCQGKGLFLSTKQLSWLAALGVFLFAATLIGGYFLGQKKAYEELSLKFEQDSFADQIYYSMCSLYDSEAEESENAESDADAPEAEESESSDSEEGAASGAQTDTPPATPLVALAPKDQAKKEVQQVEVAQHEQEEAGAEQNFYAQIAGFGTSQAAQALVNKLAKHEIKSVVNKRQSKSGRGRKVTWYQVVTPAYADKQKLTYETERIKQIAHIKDVRIVSC